MNATPALALVEFVVVFNVTSIPVTVDPPLKSPATIAIPIVQEIEPNRR